MKHLFATKQLHRFFFLSLLIALSLGQLQRLQLTPVLALYAHDVLILSWLAYASVSHHFLQPKRNTFNEIRDLLATHLKRSPSLWLLIWLAVTTVIGSLFTETLVPTLYLMRILTYLGLIVFLAESTVIPKVWLKYATLFLGGSWLVLGLLQLAFIPDLRSLRWLGFDDHFYRLASTFFDPNFAGLSFVLTIVFLYSFFTWRSFDWRLLASTSLLMIGIAATYSRASYLSLVVALVLLVALSKSARPLRLTILTTSLIVGIVTWTLLPKPGGEGVNLSRTSSISARTTASMSELQSLTPTNVLLGEGLYTSGKKYEMHKDELLPYHARVPDNFFILLLKSGGVLAVLLGFLAILEWSRRLWNWQPASVALLVALLIHAQFNNSLLEPFLFLFLGIGVAALYRTKVTKRSTVVSLPA